MPALARSAPATVSKANATRENLRKSLLNWYDNSGRDLPWRVRAGPGEPYRVWLSEVMLQQTTAAAVAPFFVKFVARWPDAASLASAPRAEVLEAWAGLGYYSRARNLHLAAQRLAKEGFPRDEAGWRSLPGVGAYTAAAIAAIAFDEPANVVDANVERVIGRLRAVALAPPQAKRRLRALAADLVTADRPGDWAQALMDLGATICTPKAPKCVACPWRGACAALATGTPEKYPPRAAKARRPQRFGVAFRAERGDALWLVRRPDKGLLGGMAGLPTTEWRSRTWPRSEALKHAPAKARWKRIGAVRHLFTHFALTLDVYAVEADPKHDDRGDDDWGGEGWWGDASALPTVFKKAASLEAEK